MISRFHSVQNLRHLARGLALVLALFSGGLMLAGPAQAEAGKVDLLNGIADMQADLQLGLLLVQNGSAGSAAGLFAHARTEVWPTIKDGLMAAGAADLDPLLQALEAAGDAKATTAAHLEVSIALAKARSALDPEARDLMQSVVSQVQLANAATNASGPTEVADYQKAWSLVMAARSQVDLLLFSRDAAVSKVASEAAFLLDDVILSIPDPIQATPVEVDAALMQDAVTRLEGLLAGM